MFPALVSVHPRVGTVQRVHREHGGCAGHAAEDSQHQRGAHARGAAQGACQGKWGLSSPSIQAGLPASGLQGGSGTANHILLCLSLSLPGSFPNNC